MTNHKRILFAPLDWGLGHITRCIPLIKECLSLGHEVIIAGNEVCHQLMKEDFSSIVYLNLTGYNIRYTTQKWLLPFSMMSQLPKILFAIRHENQWLKKVVVEHQIDLVISDNRYGLYHPSIECIFITHQLQIQIPQSTLLQRLAFRLNHYYIKKYKECWVPDYEEEPMAGCLSINENNSIQTLKYFGNLSRFEPMAEQTFSYDLLLLLSGPEPQRSLLEEILLNYFKNTTQKILLVRGKPNDAKPIQLAHPVQIVNHLPRLALEKVIQQSKLLICRAGYSTVMDLMKLKKHAMLIPTPGQTEQEYLAAYLMNKKWFFMLPQVQLAQQDWLKEYQHFSFNAFYDYDDLVYKSRLKQYFERAK